MKLWSQAEKERLWHPKHRHFPSWFYDEITDTQIRKLDDFCVEVTEGTLTKGRASDIIGLFFPMNEDEVEELQKHDMKWSGKFRQGAKVVSMR